MADTAAILGSEVMERLDALAGCSERPDALTRAYLTPEHRRAIDLVSGWMTEAGMAVGVDAVGNVVGRYEAERPGGLALALGSHLDTVRDAGRYDGTLGVVSAIAVVKCLHATHRRLPFGIEVLAFADEEGARFQSTLLGSRAVAGTFDPAVLDATDERGTTLAQALTAFGLDPGKIGDAARRRDDFLGYVEVHIEQGPVLDAEGLPVGVVTAIVGVTRLAVTIAGVAGHAGTVPMGMRRDAVAGAAEVVLAVERRCRRDGLVGTVGRVGVAPGSINVIAGEARLTIDIRAARDQARRRAVADVVREIGAICRRRGLDHMVMTTHESPTVECAGSLVSGLGEAVKRAALPVRKLTSGAGHDAMAMAALTGVGMLFVRCKGGVSHNAAEAVSSEDVLVANRILLDFVLAFGA